MGGGIPRASTNAQVAAPARVPPHFPEHIHTSSSLPPVTPAPPLRHFRAALRHPWPPPSPPRPPPSFPRRPPSFLRRQEWGGVGGSEWATTVVLRPERHFRCSRPFIRHSRRPIPACAGMTEKGGAGMTEVRGSGGGGEGGEGGGSVGSSAGGRSLPPTPHLTSPLKGGRDELGRGVRGAVRLRAVPACAGMTGERRRNDGIAREWRGWGEWGKRGLERWWTLAASHPPPNLPPKRGEG